MFFPFFRTRYSFPTKNPFDFFEQGVQFKMYMMKIQQVTVFVPEGTDVEKRNRTFEILKRK